MTLLNVRPRHARRNGNQVVRNPFFDNFFNELMNNNFAEPAKPEAKASRPAANVIEDNESFRIELAVPGLSKKDISINVEKDLLKVSANKEVETKEGEKITRKEFAYNEFSRTFRLPETVDFGKIKAAFKNGILTITLAKKEEAKELPPRTIEIK